MKTIKEIQLEKALDNACYLLSQCTQFLEVNGRKIKTPKEYKKFCMKYNVHKERDNNETN